MFNIIIFGAPGSGKGTQGQILTDRYQLTHISTGEVLREKIRKQTPLGKLADEYISKGQLVPDNVVIDILTKFFADNPTSNGYIFDGFPRTLRQGEAMDEMLAEKNESINVVLWLDVDDDELVERLVNRGKEMGRNDDNLETIKSRLKVYYQKTAPLKKFYSKQGKLVKINGMGTVEEIFSRIEKVIDSLSTKI
ncbi:MAG TPA: adenylate kinase [Bacteroidales bacterium]|nr:adenylate kinase [Bacteroidales bacterium]